MKGLEDLLGTGEVFLLCWVEMYVATFWIRDEIYVVDQIVFLTPFLYMGACSSIIHFLFLFSRNRCSLRDFHWSSCKSLQRIFISQ